MTSSRLRELSRAASPTALGVMGGPLRHGGGGKWIDICETRDEAEASANPLLRDDVAPLYLRNDAEKYADLRDAVKAVREAFNAPWHSVPDMERVRHDALNKAFAALAALGGEE